jgi:HlyD family secretion protein
MYKFSSLSNVNKAVFLIAIALIGLQGCTNEKSNAVWSGYTLGDFVYVSSPIGGKLLKIYVAPGENVSPGKSLFDLDSENEDAIRSENQAKLDSAKSTTSDLEKGKREDEIKIIEAQLAQAQSAQNYAKTTLNRNRQIFDFGGISSAELDTAITNEQQATKRVEELIASLKVAKLPSRVDEILASQAITNAARNVLKQSDWQIAQKHQISSVNGVVYELFFRIGEYVATAQPVLSILPPNNIKVRFFINETDLTGVALGQVVHINCDGCVKNIPAKISRIATQAEFTPPVIYSNSQRSKLMFLIEAYPSPENAVNLRPGQPIEVTKARNTN